ncbi:alpha/beta hydrolase fold protein [Halalkalibacter wakoensis JCM 9140]|uniref:Alpha/beta hydrolase fold protein n=1 Tax=Halalkalibacter wakoensis JCM 9140 TaxID=1236970 RepID=W4Q609_9BACI|nr:alpha/beta hydrolase [Halalkalibacter wakoensis]GAE27501.1 alpha/beta hydrolase fold protein [Halalkalibacter wakoensis JCM 9140]
MIDDLKKETIKLLNVNVYCEYAFTNKPPILLIHGFVSSTYTFNRLIPQLIKDFSVIAIDLPGFGRSEKSKSFVYSFENYAQLINECLNYFHVDRVTVVGHSMGGQIALYTAKAFPEKVKKLILIGSSGYLKPAKKSLIYCSYLPFFRYFVERYIRKKDVKKSLENVVYNQTVIHKEMMDEFTRPLSEKNFYVALLKLLRDREGDLSSLQLKEIAIPTLLIWGEEDKVVPVSIGRRLLSDLPEAELITYEKTGHLVTEEKPTEVYNHIIKYTS